MFQSQETKGVREVLGLDMVYLMHTGCLMGKAGPIFYKPTLFSTPKNNNC